MNISAGGAVIREPLSDLTDNKPATK